MTDTTVAATTIFADLQPYILAAVGAVVTAGVGYALTLLRKWLGIQVDAKTEKEVDDYFLGLAKKAIAGAADNLAATRIDVRSTLVKLLVDEALAYGPAALKKLGLGPDDIAAKIVETFGGLQASMTRVDPTKITPAPLAK